MNEVSVQGGGRSGPDKGGGSPGAGWGSLLAAAALLPGTLGAGAAGEVRGLSSSALPGGSGRDGGRQFEKLSPDRTGLDFVYHWNPAPQYERLLNSSAVGAGVGAGDYDGDGLPDLCLTRPSGGSSLYRNLGGYRFTNVTAQAGVQTTGAWTTGASFADLNNDGRLDLYICCYDAPNRLFVNRGDGTFSEEAKAFGLDFNGASMMMAFGDYDRDGRLDGYLLTGGLMPNASQRFRVRFVDGRPVVPEELQEFWQIIYQPGDRAAAAEAGQFDRLFHNEGNGTFKDVSKTAGIGGCDFGNAVLWWDPDRDGWPDLYVANDYFGPDRFYRNNRNGTFTEVTRSSLPHTPWTSMGADAADLNNDGLVDLIATDMSGTTHFKRLVDSGDQEKSGWFLDLAEPRQYMRNAVYLNTATGRFLEAAYLLGVANTDWTWSPLFGDLDDDSRVDLFFATGMTRDWMDNDLAARARSLPPAELARFWKGQPIRDDRNLAFRNLGDLRFESIAAEWGLDHPGPSFGAVLADLDGDGRLDLVVNDFEAPVRVYRNRGGTNHRIKVRLDGSVNRWGIGATVRVESRQGSQVRYLTLARGFMSAGEPLLHFGLGNAEIVTRLVVDWPGGHRQTYADLPADHLYTVQEPGSPAGGPTVTQASGTVFVTSPATDGVRHVAAAHDDFRMQPLLPWRLSTLGPGCAWADVDGDGAEELFLCGNPLHPGGLFRRAGAGNFVRDPGSGLTTTAEELAALFFDANGDGAVDLLVVGGNGATSEPPSASDRLWFNDGKGHFAVAPGGAWPAAGGNGGPTAAADYDRDGDLDVFVGGRFVPGKYPVAPQSRLLRNDGGVFTDVTESVAPECRAAGMVSGATWSDVDNDGWLDLLVACDWGPIRLFRGQEGRLVERTRESGLGDRLGWWRGLAAGDLNNDGAVDYVVGNLGLNTRYQPSPEAPCRLYRGDFGGTGEPQLLEALATADGVYPLRGKGALEQVLPRLSERFPTHRQFASARLSEIVGAAALEAAERVEVNTAESGLLLNDGTGRFKFQPLPRLAQIAPVFGVAVADFNGDGTLDLVLAQNFHGPHRETGRMDGGLGLLVLGRGDGTFEPLWPGDSGVMVPGDARSVTVTDFNADGWPDCLVTVHNGPVVALQNRGSATNRFINLRLDGKPGNPTGVGARVELSLRGGARRVAEVYAGGGYLSQSTPVLSFGLGATDAVERIRVRWPDGRSASLPGPDPGAKPHIRQE